MRKRMKLFMLALGVSLGVIVAPSTSAQALTVQSGPYLAPQRVAISDAPAGTTSLSVKFSANLFQVTVQSRPEPGPTGVNWSVPLVPFEAYDGIAPFENSTLYVETTIYDAAGSMGDRNVVYVPTMASVPSSSCVVSKQGRARCTWSSRVNLSETTLSLTLERKLGKTWRKVKTKTVRQSAVAPGPGKIKGVLKPPKSKPGIYRLRAEVLNELVFEGITAPAGEAEAQRKLAGSRKTR